MPSSNRASSSDGRNLVILLLILVGGFLAFCGWGADEGLMIALGVVVAAAGPVMVMVLNSRNKVRVYVQGSALVEDITPRPTQEGRVARGRLKLTITAPGIRGITVSGIDPAIPLEKWPEPGATLPVQVLKGAPRKFTVLWDRVQTHQEVVLAEQRGPIGGADDLGGNYGYSLDGDDYGRPSDDLLPPDNTLPPPDNTPTLTNLPPIDAGIDEHVGSGGVATLAPPATVTEAEQIPEAARRQARPGRPRHAAADPAHYTSEPLGAGSTAVAFAEAPIVEPEPEAEVEAEAESPAKETPASGAGQTIIGDEDEPIIMRLRSTPKPSPHRRPSPHPRTGAHDRVRRGRPGRGRTAAETETETETEADETPEEAETTPVSTTAVAETQPEEYTIPEAGYALVAPPAAPEPEPESGIEPRPEPEIEWWTDSFPDRETELPPVRAEHTEPTVIEGELAEEPAPEPTRSAWAGNGRGPVPVGAGLYSAPPILRPPPMQESDDDEAVAPDPYATEHYLPPEDQLEEQPLSEGAVAEFLATAPRRQTMPLDGVNGVSITLIVSDLQRSRRFYRDTLGLTELDSGETSAVLETGTARVVLRRVADMPPVDRRVVHLNLDVPDVYEAYERLREQGVDFVHRPRTVPQGEHLELCSATFRDPDGHAIALTRWELRR
ncbi:VOC family protein [Dactylosporangium sp. CA-139066]|uniref:VOC family protein n=1 Tax=Dactylosporangium sp. CA-139066 TaxID=3239930 RepID=UPI003D909F9A